MLRGAGWGSKAVYIARAAAVVSPYRKPSAFSTYMPTIDPDWARLLVAAATGGLAAAVITAFVKNWLVHPVISLLYLGEKSGSSALNLRSHQRQTRVHASSVMGPVMSSLPE
jgi:hypothetical protein